MKFPKVTASALKGMSGQSYFEHFVHNYLKCIYHPVHQENDFGIDGYIEIVKDGKAIGKKVSVQIKHGDYYFSHPLEYGYRYIGEDKHLNYYLNSQVPVYIIIMDECFERLYWVKFDLLDTFPEGNNNWSIEIPAENKLETTFKHSLMQDLDLAAFDYEDAIFRNWTVNCAVASCDYRVIIVSKEEVSRMDYDFLWHILNRFTVQKDILINSVNSLDISFYGYDYDPRELFQIPEILNWLKGSIEIGIPWFYFLMLSRENVGMNLLIHAFCSCKSVKKQGNIYLTQYDNYKLSEFIYINYVNLNLFLQKHKIDGGIREEIMERVNQYFYKNV